MKKKVCEFNKMDHHEHHHKVFPAVDKFKKVDEKLEYLEKKIEALELKVPEIIARIDEIVKKLEEKKEEPKKEPSVWDDIKRLFGCK